MDVKPVLGYVEELALSQLIRISLAQENINFN